MPVQTTGIQEEESINENITDTVREDVTVMTSVSSSTTDLKAKIVELTKQLSEVEGLKKSANKGFNDSIKDIKAEIKMTLDLIKNEESNNG